jgi:hypothetical protein
MPRPQRPPNLNDRVRVERRADLIDANEDILWDEGDTLEHDDETPIQSDEETIGDGAGNFEGDWVGIGPAVLRCEITELGFGSGEEVIAGKLRGVENCTVEVRVSKFTRQLTTDDRFRIPNSDRVLNIRHAPPPGRTNFIKFTCEAGVAT